MPMSVKPAMRRAVEVATGPLERVSVGLAGISSDILKGRARSQPNSKQFRGFLLDAMRAVQEGRLGASEALAISKLAAQINQNLATEINLRIQFKANGIEAADEILAIEATEPLTKELPA